MSMGEKKNDPMVQTLKLDMGALVLLQAPPQISCVILSKAHENIFSKVFCTHTRVEFSVKLTSH